MKLIGSGAHDTPLKYIWTFSFVLIFIHVYNTSKVPEEEEEEETLYMWVNIKTMQEVQMYFSDVLFVFAF